MIFKGMPEDDLVKLINSFLDDRGREIPNPRPKVVDSGLRRPPTLREQIARVLRTELSLRADKNEMDTFTEANDFEVMETFNEEPSSRYELMEEEFLKNPEETPLAETGKFPSTGDDNPGNGKELETPEIKDESE